MVAAVRLLARLVAFLDYVVKLFAGGGDKDGAGLGGSDPGLAQRSASGGNPRSLDQSMVPFSVISSLEASVWSFFCGDRFLSTSTSCYPLNLSV
jgi:hypothetical protein